MRHAGNETENYIQVQHTRRSNTTHPEAQTNQTALLPRPLLVQQSIIPVTLILLPKCPRYGWHCFSNSLKYDCCLTAAQQSFVTWASPSPVPSRRDVQISGPPEEEVGGWSVSHERLGCDKTGMNGKVNIYLA
jgi:hypothetical protein